MALFDELLIGQSPVILRRSHTCLLFNSELIDGYNILVPVRCCKIELQVYI